MTYRLGFKEEGKNSTTWYYKRKDQKFFVIKVENRCKKAILIKGAIINTSKGRIQGKTYYIEKIFIIIIDNRIHWECVTAQLL